MENYEFLGVIGEGTYGVVMKARHKETGQVVAIKKFKESDEDEQVRKTSLREVRVLKQLRHDNVITLLEVFRRKGKLYLVFEYVENTILEVLERKPNGLDEQEVRKYTYQLLRGVEYCHAHNIIHRDVKPENILISKNGALKLCDFGFARPMSVGGKYTDYVATRWYRCPELLVGDVEYGKGVDVWAIGCIFAEISNGMPLFAGESDVDQLNCIMRCQGKLTNRQVQIFRRNPLYVGVELPAPRDLETLDMRFPNAPKNWLNFLKACLKNDPDQRETCSSLTAMPYFTERNFRAEYDAELKMIMEKENRANSLRRPPTDGPTPTNQTKTLPDHVSGAQTTNQTPPVNTKPSYNNAGASMYNNTGHATQDSRGQAPSLWSQYLQSSSGSGGTSGGGEFPGLGNKAQNSSTGNSGQHHGFLPQTQKSSHATGYHPHMSGGSGSGSNSGSGHSSYLTSYAMNEPMMVTNASSSKQYTSHQATGGYGLSGGSSTKKSSLSGGSSEHKSGTLPTLNPSHQGQTSSSNAWGLPPAPASQPPPNAGNQGAASQLSYKKKPGKRNVLSTLSLTAFGGSQAQGGYNALDSNAPGPTGSGGSGGSGSGLLMLHGSSHAYDSSHNQPRRSSKPWM